AQATDERSNQQAWRLPPRTAFGPRESGHSRLRPRDEGGPANRGPPAKHPNDAGAVSLLPRRRRGGTTAADFPPIARRIASRIFTLVADRSVRVREAFALSTRGGWLRPVQHRAKPYGRRRQRRRVRFGLARLRFQRTCPAGFVIQKRVENPS